MSDVTNRRFGGNLFETRGGARLGICASPGVLRRAGSEHVTRATRRAARAAPAKPTSNLQSEAAASQRGGPCGTGPTANAAARPEPAQPRARKTTAHFKTVCKQPLGSLASGSSNINTVEPDRPGLLWVPARTQR